MLWMSNITDSGRPAITDEDLKSVLLCQKGETEAFGVLVERHQKEMLNIAFRMTGDYNEACDITQEAFVSAYKSIKTFKGEAKFSTWLYRIVVNYSKNRLKQMSALNKREGLRIDDPEKKRQEASINQSFVNHDHPGTQIEMREREYHVRQCITSLDDEYREVLVLRDIQGFSYDKIRDILKIPDGTVKSRLSRARNALKNCLIKVMSDL